MNPFVVTQIQSIVEDLRLLEVLVAAPLGLHSDIRMLRQSIPLEQAADLDHDRERQRRLGYQELLGDPPAAALSTIEHLGASLSMLDSCRDRGGTGLGEEWTDRAARVLARARHKVSGDLRVGAASKVQGLYVIVDPEVTSGRPVAQVARAALSGGAKVVQLRDKLGEWAGVLPVAQEIASLCRDHGASFVVNDDPSLAFAAGAHGLHVGQADVPVSQARRVLSPGQIVGRSNNSLDEVAQSQAHGADYIAVGAIYATSTMGKTARPAVGLDLLAKAKDIVGQPLVAIGGINAANVAEVVRAGADCVCVVSAVTMSDNPEAAARSLVEAIQNAKSQA